VASGSNDDMDHVKPKPSYTPDSDRYRDLIDEVIEPELRRVGTGRFFIAGGQEREVEVLVDPKALSRSQPPALMSLLPNGNNRDIRSSLVLGRREYRCVQSAVLKS